MTTPPAEGLVPASILRKFICSFGPGSLFDCGLARSNAKLPPCPYVHLVEDQKFTKGDKKHASVGKFYSPPGTVPLPVYDGQIVDELVGMGCIRLEPLICLGHLENHCYEITAVRPNGYVFCESGRWHPTSNQMLQLSKTGTRVVSQSDGGRGSILVTSPVRSVVVPIPPMDCPRDTPTQQWNTPSQKGNTRTQQDNSTEPTSDGDSAGVSTTVQNSVANYGGAPTTSQTSEPRSNVPSAHEQVIPQAAEEDFCTQVNTFTRNRPLLCILMLVLFMLLIGGIAYALSVHMRT